MEDELPPRDSFDSDEDYDEARRLVVARVRADEEKARIKKPTEQSSLFKADEFGSTRKFTKQKNSTNRILALHHTIMVGEKDRAAAAGVYRMTDVFVGDDPIGVPAWEIEVAMTAFCQWLKEANEALNGGGSELARFLAMAHRRLVQIHPAEDRNGRLARLLMNVLLKRRGKGPLYCESHSMTSMMSA